MKKRIVLALMVLLVCTSCGLKKTEKKNTESGNTENMTESKMIKEETDSTESGAGKDDADESSENDRVGILKNAGLNVKSIDVNGDTIYVELLSSGYNKIDEEDCRAIIMTHTVLSCEDKEKSYVNIFIKFINKDESVIYEDEEYNVKKTVKREPFVKETGVLPVENFDFIDSCEITEAFIKEKNGYYVLCLNVKRNKDSISNYFIERLSDKVSKYAIDNYNIALVEISVADTESGEKIVNIITNHDISGTIAKMADGIKMSGGPL